MCGSQDTALLYSTVNLEGLRYFSIKANSAMHVYMKDAMMLRSLGGHPIFSSSLNSAVLLTMSKALVKLIKA